MLPCTYRAGPCVSIILTCEAGDSLTSWCRSTKGGPVVEGIPYSCAQVLVFLASWRTHLYKATFSCCLKEYCIFLHSSSVSG